MAERVESGVSRQSTQKKISPESEVGPYIERKRDVCLHRVPERVERRISRQSEQKTSESGFGVLFLSCVCVGVGGVVLCRCVCVCV